MIETLVSLIVVLIIFGILWYVVTLLPLPAPLPLVIQLLVLLILVLVLFDTFLGGGFFRGRLSR